MSELTKEDIEFLTPKNREKRRRKTRNSLFTKKGFIPHLNAIKHIRKNNGKKKIKYLPITKQQITIKKPNIDIE